MNVITHQSPILFMYTRWKYLLQQVMSAWGRAVFIFEVFWQRDSYKVRSRTLRHTHTQLYLTSALKVIHPTNFGLFYVEKKLAADICEALKVSSLWASLKALQAIMSPEVCAYLAERMMGGYGCNESVRDDFKDELLSHLWEQRCLFERPCWPGAFITAKANTQ